MANQASWVKPKGGLVKVQAGQPTLTEKRTEFQASNSFALGLLKSDFRALVPAKLPGDLGQVDFLTP